MNGLEDIAKNYENVIKKIASSFTHDGSYIDRINQIIKSLHGESPAKAGNSKEK